uniref:Protein SSUH2 homolog n=1 Tax=Syphacia muris TaxID=451379 RepID=A0A0N5AR55_9BILA
MTDQKFDLIPPPPANNLSNQRSYLDNNGPKRYFDDVRRITEEEVREALRHESKRHKYWNSKTVNKMEIDNIETTACYHYVLESFTESRSTAKATEGVPSGQFLEYRDNPGNSNLNINPWEYEFEPDEEFVERTKIITMPGTSELQTCGTCNGQGLIHCFYCRGYGTDKCGYCRGTGMKAGVAHPAVYTHPMIGTFPHSDMSRGYPGTGTAVIRPQSGDMAYGVGTPIHFMAKAGVPPPGIGHHDLCLFCHGRGLSDCSHCKGHGKKPCTVCGGSGTVRQFVKLRITMAVERSDFYTQCEIPEKLLHRAEGQVVLSECLPHVLPIKKHPVSEVNEKSRQLCVQHLDKCLGKSRIIKQRHCLIAIPAAKVLFHLGTKPGYFYIYGNERSCYVPNYPTKCLIL